MDNKKFEIKSFARIKFLSNIESGLGTSLDSVFVSEKINLFDTIFFEEKNKGKGSIEIRKNGNIKIPTNDKNICFLVSKELQKTYAKKNLGNKPKSLIITIEKNIPINSGLGGMFSNGIETLFFLNYFWNLNLPREDLLKILENILGFHGDLSYDFLRFKKKKIFILIPKYIFIEKKYFKSQKEVKSVFPDLKKFIKIFLDNGAKLSDVSGRGSSVFGIFDENISNEKIEKLKFIFKDFGELKIL